MKQKNRKWSKSLLIILGVLFVLIIFLLLFFLIKSPGVIEPFKNPDGTILENSISEKVWIDAGDTKLGMIIRGKNKNNPVLLVLHGGPGMPEYFLKDQYPTNIEDMFTVCWLEQRGAGLSYDPSLTADDITLEKLIEDNLLVSQYLSERFQQEKIYLMGHSWGTYLGIHTISSYPEYFHAYIGVAQIANQTLSEELALDYILTEYQKSGNDKMVNRIQSDYTASLRDKAMHETGIGTARDMDSVVWGVFFPSLLCESYTMTEKVNLWRGKAFLSSCELTYSEDLKESITSVPVPVYFVSGKYDYTVNYDLSKEYFAFLEAPAKGFYSFENSAHSPHLEEPEEFEKRVLADVIGNSTENSDPIEE